MTHAEISGLDIWITATSDYPEPETKLCDCCEFPIDETETDFCESCLCEGDDCDGCVYCLCVTDYNARKANGTLKTQ